LSWSTSSDVHTFLAAAGEFIGAAPVDNTLLLTESAYLVARPVTDALFGWYDTADGEVAGAFLQAPHHPPVLSSMPDQAIASLVDTFNPPYNVDSRLVERFRVARPVIEERSRITLYRLDHLHATAPQPGQARVATPADRDLLVDWFGRLMAGHPHDPTDLEYVVDDPLSYGGITLWEVDGVPTGMAGRSRLIAGMVRLSAQYPSDGDGRSAFVAACAAAAQIARDVLVFGPIPDDADYLSLGFTPVLDRVMLAPA
jgi:hypothetical protein